MVQLDTSGRKTAFFRASRQHNCLAIVSLDGPKSLKELATVSVTTARKFEVERIKDARIYEQNTVTPIKVY
jgi:hypothetical protein